MAEAKRVLILAKTPEMAGVFSASAEKLALRLISGCARDADLNLDFSTRDAALAVVNYAQREPFAAIIAVGDDTAPVAARAGSMLRLPFHTPKAADVCRDKQILARKLEAACLLWEGHDFPRAEERSRSASDSVWEGHDFSRAEERSRSAGDSVWEGHDFSRADKKPPSDAPLGAEVSPSGPKDLAVDCIMTRGRLRVVAVTEGRCVVPARSLRTELMNSASDVLRRLIALLGLKHGPVRVSFSRQSKGLCISDVSCAYVPGIDRSAMRFSIPLVDQDVSFEELVLRNALDLDTSRVLLATKPS